MDVLVGSDVAAPRIFELDADEDIDGSVEGPRSPLPSGGTTGFGRLVANTGMTGTVNDGRSSSVNPDDVAIRIRAEFFSKREG
jgi:hypothetical protein